MTTKDIKGKKIVVHIEMDMDDTTFIENINERLGEDYEFTDEEIRTYVLDNTPWEMFFTNIDNIKLK